MFSGWRSTMVTVNINKFLIPLISSVTNRVVVTPYNGSPVLFSALIQQSKSPVSIRSCIDNNDCSLSLICRGNDVEIHSLISGHHFMICSGGKRISITYPILYYVVVVRFHV